MDNWALTTVELAVVNPVVSSSLSSSPYHGEEIAVTIKKWSRNIWVEMLLEDLLILKFYICWMSKMQNYFYHMVQWFHNVL